MYISKWLVPEKEIIKISHVDVQFGCPLSHSGYKQNAVNSMYARSLNYDDETT